MGIKRISILCRDDNLKSIKVSEKLNYIHELTAWGIISKIGNNNLVLGRRYTKFDLNGLDESGVKW